DCPRRRTATGLQQLRDLSEHGLVGAGAAFCGNDCLGWSGHKVIERLLLSAYCIPDRCQSGALSNFSRLPLIPQPLDQSRPFAIVPLSEFIRSRMPRYTPGPTIQGEPVTASGQPSGVTTQQIYQLRITLKGAPLPVWRRVQVSAELTLARLHEVI